MHKENRELTLLAESVLANGSFWNASYWDTHGALTPANPLLRENYQNYMVSTLNTWLNADTMDDNGVSKGAVIRTDGCSPFMAGADKPALRGFMDEAFSAKEQFNINSRTIKDIQGMAQGNAITEVTNYDPIGKAYKVWAPSWTEIYGNVQYEGKNVLDGSPDKQFSYFSGVTPSIANDKLQGKLTSFVITPGKSNYASDADTSFGGNIARSWMLRSPTPSYQNRMQVIWQEGIGDSWYTYDVYHGVRPAINIPA